MRALLCARHSRRLPAQLVAFDTGKCAPSAGCTVSIMFLTTSALDSARHGPASRTRGAPASKSMQSAHARRIGGGLERNRAPLDADDGVPGGLTMMAAGCTKSSASLAPTATRRAWQFANSVSQLFTSDGSGRAIWAWHTTPNATSAERIAARLLQRSRDESTATIVKPQISTDSCNGRARWP